MFLQALGCPQAGMTLEVPNSPGNRLFDPPQGAIPPQDAQGREKLPASFDGGT